MRFGPTRPARASQAQGKANPRELPGNETYRRGTPCGWKPTDYHMKSQGMACDALFKDAENLVFAQDENLLPIDLDFGSRIFSEQHLIACLHLGRNTIARIEHFARADCDHFAALRFFLRAVRNVQASKFRFTFFNAPDDYAIV